MIDLHSHILPQMDDGSKSPEESRRLLEIMKEQGINTVVATPHFYARREDPETFLRRRREAFEKLPGGQELPKVLLGAEVAWFSGMKTCEALNRLQIGNTGLLLVEMPFSPWTEQTVEEVCQIPMHLGLTPVLAHAERYLDSGKIRKYMEYFLQNDVLLQCNTYMLKDFWRGRWICKQLENGNVHFLGSDCHGLQARAPKWGEATALLKKRLGVQKFDDFVARSQGLLEQKHVF